MPVDDVALGSGRHRAGVVGEPRACLTLLLALLDLADLLGELGDELVIDRGLDEDPLHRDADLAGVEHAAPGDAVGGAIHVGVGQHDRWILTAEFEAARDEPLGAGHRDLAAGARRSGEVDVVGVRDHRGAGGAVAGGQGEYRRGADLVPAANQFDGRKWRHLRGFQQDSGTGGERGNQVQRQHGKREVPRLDHADERVGPVNRGELLDLEQRAVRAGMLVGEELLGVAGPVLDGVGDQDGLDAGVVARLARLGHQDIGQQIGVVQDPVLPLEHPLLAPAGADGLPLRLEQPQLTRLGRDGVGSVDRNRADDVAVGGVVDGDGVGLGFNCGHCGFLSRRSTSMLSPSQFGENAEAVIGSRPR